MPRVRCVLRLLLPFEGGSFSGDAIIRVRCRIGGGDVDTVGEHGTFVVVVVVSVMILAVVVSPMEVEDS